MLSTLNSNFSDCYDNNASMDSNQYQHKAGW